MDYYIWKVFVLQYFVFKTAFRFVSPFYIGAQYTLKICGEISLLIQIISAQFGHLK